MFITRTKLSIFIIKVTINRVIKLIWWLKREPPPSVDYEKEKPWFLGGGFIEVRERERERYEACRWVGGN